ncbi:MAG: biopolymer transporter ExbD [Alcanivorax sp.]|nr:biopolymer transporter ExbD [Alcanivorax sp.]
MKFCRPEEEEVSLNLAPLIDVVFLLLIFFMITTTFNKDNVIDLSLPEASSEQAQPTEFTVRITVSKLDEITIETDQSRFKNVSGGGESVSERRRELSKNISQAIESLRNGNPSLAGISPTIVIQADKAASHGRVIHLMDAISQLGINKIQFAVAPDQS